MTILYLFFFRLSLLFFVFFGGYFSKKSEFYSFPVFQVKRRFRISKFFLMFKRSSFWRGRLSFLWSLKIEKLPLWVKCLERHWKISENPKDSNIPFSLTRSSQVTQFYYDLFSLLFSKSHIISFFSFGWNFASLLQKVEHASSVSLNYINQVIFLENALWNDNHLIQFCLLLQNFPHNQQVPIFFFLRITNMRK